MPLDPTIASTLSTGVNSIDTKEQALATASDANSAAQAAAQAAIAAAGVTLQSQTSARADLTAAIKSLQDYLDTL